MPFIWTHEADSIDDLCLLRDFVTGNDFEDVKDNWKYGSPPLPQCTRVQSAYRETQAIFHISWRIEMGSSIVRVVWCS